ncbi:MAG: GDP-mannose 4,6-dehydratase [Alphaproteobacteria bacterium]|nr:GDP-mannose 4,6-dehydratase [Alphaproteobacteria bacterium]
MTSQRPDFAGARTVVTGGAGFIGSHLVDALLAAGCDRVAVVDNLFLGKRDNIDQATQHGERFHLYREDAGERTAMEAVIEAEKPDIVFNLATKALLYSFFNPAGACSLNLDIALILADLLRRGTYGRLVHVSTSEVYGSAVRTPMNEDHPMLAETTYAAGKAAADLALASYVHQFDIDVTTIRPFNNYGPRQNDGALAAIVPITIKRILSGEKPVIEGDGLQTRDFVYVADTIDGLLRIAGSDAARGEVYNLASGRETTIKSIVDGICDALGYSGEIDWRPARTADVRRHLAGVDKARALIGEVAPTKLEDGLLKTVEWYRSRNRR